VKKLNKQRLNEIKEQLEGTAIIGELYVKGDLWKGYEVIDNHNRMLIGEFSNKTEAELLASAPKAISELVNEVERLSEALEFYADSSNYEPWRESDIDRTDAFHCIDLDAGLTARQALEGKQYGPSTD